MFPVRFGKVEKRYALKPGFPIWQPGFPAAPLGIYSGRVAFPKRREAFTGWQGVSRPFRKSRKKVCLGSLASPFGSLAFPQRCRGFTVAKWLSKGAAKHLRGGRVFPVRFGKVEKRYALGAWLPHLAAWLSRSAAGDLQWQGGFPKAPRGIYRVARCFPSVSEG